MRLNKSAIIIFISICLSVVFFIVLNAIENGTIALFDNMIFNAFNRNEDLTMVMKAITFWGESSTLITLTVILLIFIKDKTLACSIPINLYLVSLINTILKSIVQRPRPIGIRLIEIGGYSFPSGHSATSLAFYGFLIYLIYKKCKNKYLKFILMITLCILIISIGVSRIYLGVHYASDVVGGFTFGGVFLLMYISTYNSLNLVNAHK